MSCDASEIFQSRVPTTFQVNTSTTVSFWDSFLSIGLPCGNICLVLLKLDMPCLSDISGGLPFSEGKQEWI